MSLTSLYTSLLSDLIHNVKEVYTKQKTTFKLWMEHYCKLLQLLKPLLHNHSPIKVCYRVPSLYSFHLSTACSQGSSFVRRQLWAYWTSNSPAAGKNAVNSIRAIWRCKQSWSCCSICSRSSSASSAVGAADEYMAAKSCKKFSAPRITGQKWSCQILQVDLAVGEY